MAGMREPETIQRNAFEESRNVLFRALRDLNGNSDTAYDAVVALESYLETRDTHLHVGTGEVTVPNPEHTDNVESWRDHETFADAEREMLGEPEEEIPRRKRA